MADQVAVVGAACRFPASPDLETFWKVVAESGDATTEASPTRWPAPRRPEVARGGFLEAIEEFDALAFSMSPAQASETDPQQRLVLEVATEALEDARLGPADLASHPVGVYVGIGASEYDARFVTAGAAVRGLYSGLGNDSSFAAGRLASLLGLRGPALAINTACSSALVAIHTALQDLRSGSCDVAVVGAVNLLVIPENSSRLARMGVLAADGRSKPFDRAADGYGRAEGAGVIVLANREVAERLGLRVRAWLAGAAVNQDAGETGLTAPNPRAQAAVIDAALADAGLDVDAIDVLEAHGTGTPTGDPVELQALGRAFEGRTRPLPIGSVKSNVGHLEVAAGMAGVLKALGMLERGEPLPHRIHTAPVSLPRPLCLAGSGLATESGGAARTIGVSAFGLSGTNAHVVLTHADSPAPATSGSTWPGYGSVLVASASGEDALRTLARQLAVAVDRDPAGFEDLAASSALTRRSLTHRLAVMTRDPVVARHTLERYAADGTVSDPSVARIGEAHAPPPATLLVGDLAGDWAPLVERLRAWPAFAEAVDGVSAERLPLAVAVGLAAQWRAFGLTFRRVEGLGEGNRAAAVIRGDCTLDDVDTVDVTPEAASTAHDDELVFVIGTSRVAGTFAATPDTTVEALLGTVADAWCRGVPVDWAAVHGPSFTRTALPPTPWQRVRAWVDDVVASTPTGHASAAPAPTVPTAHRVWRPLEGLPLRNSRRRWVVIADHQGVSEALARTLTPAPRLLRLVDPAAPPPHPLAGAVDVDALSPETWANAVGNLDDVAGVLFLAGLDQRSAFDVDGRPDPTAADDAVRATWLAARWARVLLEATPPRGATSERIQFLLATRGAVAVGDGERVDPTHAALWGLGATLALEHPELGVGTVDLDPTGELGSLVALLGVTPTEDQIALRGDHAQAARLVPAPPSPGATWGPGPVLVTGGLGALGTHVAEALVDAGVTTIWLAGRTPPAAATAARLEHLRARGATVETFGLDVADGAAVRDFARDHQPTGWIHAAGVLADGIALHLTPERTLVPMRPKVHGTLELAAALDPETLRHVVFCSSLAGLLGAMGQANYAAANSWMNAFAEGWRARGGAAVSVALGPIGGEGMAAPHVDRLARAGFRALSPSDAARLIVGVGPSTSLVAGFEVDAGRLVENPQLRPLLTELVASTASDEPVSSGPRGSRDGLATWLAERIASDLGLAVGSLDPRRPLAWHGFDSLLAIELKRSLDAELGTALPSAPFLSGPSLDELVDAIAPLVLDQDPPTVAPVTARASFGSMPSLSALRPASTGPGLPAMRLQGPAATDVAAPLPLPVQFGLAAMVAAALGLAWFLAQ